MKKLFLGCAAVLSLSSLCAQQKEGVVIYERTMQMQIHINDNDQVQQMLPKSRTDKFELSFGSNRSLWKHVDEDQQNDEFGGGGMQIRMMTPGTEDITYCNFGQPKTLLINIKDRFFCTRRDCKSIAKPQLYQLKQLFELKRFLSIYIFSDIKWI